jgi:hypothetical protein
VSACLKENISGEEQEKKSMMDANTIFVGCILGVLADRLIDVYMHIKDRKKLWDELNAKFDASNAGNELYTSSSGLYLLPPSLLIITE